MVIKPYKNYAERLQKQADALFEQIMSTYNFDQGDEFEVALCKFLKLVLPQKYSICRGHIVDKMGVVSKGDDIIIYDNIKLIPGRQAILRCYIQCCLPGI